MNNLDINLVRYRPNSESEWQYEICSDDDLDNYHNCQSDYGRMQDNELRLYLEKFEFEVLNKGIINVGNDLWKRIFAEDV